MSEEGRLLRRFMRVSGEKKEMVKDSDLLTDGVAKERA